MTFGLKVSALSLLKRFLRFVFIGPAYSGVKEVFVRPSAKEAFVNFGLILGPDDSCDYTMWRGTRDAAVEK